MFKINANNKRLESSLFLKLKSILISRYSYSLSHSLMGESRSSTNKRKFPMSLLDPVNQATVAQEIIKLIWKSRAQDR